MDTSWEFHTDPAAFVHAASAYLGRDPVVNSVVATIANRGLVYGPPDSQAPYWFAALRDGAGVVVSAAMRTAQAELHPLFVLPMPDEAALELTRALQRRGEAVGGANGALPVAQIVAEEAARLQGGSTELETHTRLFRLDKLTAARRAPGRLRPVQETDLPVALSWHGAFGREAGLQAGRAPAAFSRESVDSDAVRRKINTGRLWFWEDEGGQVVHMTGANPPSFGAARIGPVYTPPEHRGHGWASAAVAQVAQGILDEGAVPCLFADQANPVSNRLYQALGFRPVVDMANFVLR